MISFFNFDFVLICYNDIVYVCNPPDCNGHGTCSTDQLKCVGCAEGFLTSPDCSNVDEVCENALNLTMIAPTN